MLSRDEKPTTEIQNKVQKAPLVFPQNEISHQMVHGRRSYESEQWGRWYRQGKYRKARARFLTKHPFCAVCGKPATDLDHIVPHRGDLSLFWDESNWQGLCHRCHSKKTMEEMGLNKRKEGADGET